MGRQTAQEKADALGAAAVLRGNPELYNTELANYQKVTAADVQRVCAEVPRQHERNTAVGES